MNPLLPAPRELARVLGRQATRLRRLVARRRLGQAETTLGLLGWQQADFEGDAQRPIDQLTNVEREQARLTNESAQLAIALRQLQDTRAAALQRSDETRALLEAARAQVAAPVAETERQLTERQTMQANFAERTRDLDQELAATNRRQDQLRAIDTAEARGEMLRGRGRVWAIPKELTEIRLRQQQIAHELRPLEEALARGRSALALEDEKLRIQQADFQQADHALRDEISDRTRERQSLEKQIHGLEKAKGDPYRQIGQMLADSGIAPMNQPQALAAVQQARADLARLEVAIATSLGLSENEPRTALRYSFLFWITVALLAALVIAAAWR